MKHHTSHAPRPLSPRRNNPRPFQRPPQTETPNKRRCQSDPIARKGYRFFFQHIVYYSSLTSDQTNTKIRHGASSGRPQMKQKPQMAQNAIPQTKLQPPTPIKLLFDFSLIYTVLRKVGNKGEEESPVPLKALLPKHHSSPLHSQNGPGKRQV